MDGRALSSRFHDLICLGRLVSWICDFPNPVKPMNSLIGIFPKASISATRPQQMDGSDLRRGFHCGDSRSHNFDEMTSAGPHDGFYLLSGFHNSEF
jgi:hypothetical protein